MYSGNEGWRFGIISVTRGSHWHKLKKQNKTKRTKKEIIKKERKKNTPFNILCTFFSSFSFIPFFELPPRGECLLRQISISGALQVQAARAHSRRPLRRLLSSYSFLLLLVVWEGKIIYVLTHRFRPTEPLTHKHTYKQIHTYTRVCIPKQTKIQRYTH